MMKSVAVAARVNANREGRRKNPALPMSESGQKQTSAAAIAEGIVPFGTGAT